MKRRLLIVLAAFVLAFLLRGAEAASGDVVKAILWDPTTKAQAGTSTVPLYVNVN